MTMSRYWDYGYAARANYAEGRYVASWMNLFEEQLAKDEQTERWKIRNKTTPRQEEVQRLWQQRGLLERTKANLRIVKKEIPAFFDAAVLDQIELYIEQNKQAAATVKERIPSCSN